MRPIIQTVLEIQIVQRKDKVIIPAIVMAIQAAQKKAQNENAQNQQLAQNMQNAIQMQNQPQFPTIKSVFGSY